ncbi:DUF2993 domain-containing protein [Actinoplanes sp. NPDC051861]|uniref:LmeA family phospholipid-binding protein n=1 Tax=Actinoplanes sp. NPDC051861 TaxID=3155170 RepID=UPI0034306BA5
MRKSLIITAALLVVAVGTADRVAASAAADRLADRLRCAGGLPSSPDVSIGGVPFLTQLARGRLHRVTVSAPQVPVGRLTAAVRATASDVRLPASGAASAASVQINITLGYGQLPVDVSPGADGRLVIPTVAPVLGREVPVVVHAEPSLSGPAVVIKPVEVELSAVGLRFSAERLGDRVPSRTLALPSLPSGLHYDGVSVAAEGLRLTVSGSDVTVPGSARGGDRGCGDAS